MNEKEAEKLGMSQAEYQDYRNHRIREMLERKKEDFDYHNNFCECGCELDDIGYCPRCDY